MTTRECGTCTLCCKVLGIGALGKPAGQWCPHCQPGKGCAVYETRPEECRTFLCDWLRNEALGPEWKPEKSKIVLASSGKNIIAYVDPSSPMAWRKVPFFERLTSIMHKALPNGGLVYVAVADHYTVLLPDKQQEIGRIGPGDDVILKTFRTALGGLEYDVDVVRGASPGE
jgi:hypothetical protein